MLTITNFLACLILLCLLSPPIKWIILPFLASSPFLLYPLQLSVLLTSMQSARVAYTTQRNVYMGMRSHVFRLLHCLFCGCSCTRTEGQHHGIKAETYMWAGRPGDGQEADRSAQEVEGHRHRNMQLLYTTNSESQTKRKTGRDRNAEILQSHLVTLKPLPQSLLISCTNWTECCLTASVKKRTFRVSVYGGEESSILQPRSVCASAQWSADRVQLWPRRIIAKWGNA